MKIRISNVASVVFGVLTAIPAYATDPGVPKILYHYGEYDVLIKDVNARTVPVTDWDKYIMGDATRYGQKWYRRGLYGSIHPAYAAYFSDINSGNGKQQWLMSVEIADRCRSEKPYDLRSLYRDPRVSNYIRAHSDGPYRSAEDFRDVCYPADPRLKLRIPKLESITGKIATNDCESFVNRLFVALRPKVIIDGEWPGSWYLRDQACIKTIKGTPAEVAEMLALPGFWSKNYPSGEIREGNPRENTSGLAILMKVLASPGALGKSSAQRLFAAVSKSDMRNTLGWQPGNEKPGWMAKVTTNIMRKFMRCQAQNRLESFQENLSALLRELNQSKNFDETAELIVEKSGC